MAAEAGQITFQVEYAKTGRSTCRLTKEKIEKGAIRMGKVPPPNPDNPAAGAVQWFGLTAFWTHMRRMRSANKLNNVDELAGFDQLTEQDQQMVRKQLAGFWDGSLEVQPPPQKKRPAPVTSSSAAEDGASESSSTAPPPKKAKKKSADYASDPRPWDRSQARVLAEEVLALARTKKIKLASDDAQARTACGSKLLEVADDEAGTVDIGAVLRALHAQFGADADTLVECVCEANAGLASMFKELAGHYFKMGDTFKGVGNNKVTKALAEHPSAITSGKEAAKLKGIGKSSAEKIDQFLETGTCTALEEFRSTS